jgi:hypothetical protein
LAWLSW